MLKKPVKAEESESEGDDEFNVGSDQEADGGVNIPVSRFQSKFLGAKDAGKKQASDINGKDTLEELLELNEARTSLLHNQQP